MTSPREQFDRKICSCAECCVGCRTMPGSLIPGDVERIAAHLGIVGDAIYDFVKGHFCAGYSVVGVKKGNEYVPHITPTITPQQRPDGRCVFLGPSHECTIHPVSPFNCSHFDAHMDDKEAERRSLAGLMASNKSAGYRALHDYLTQSGKVARLLAERKKAFEEEWLRAKRRKKNDSSQIG